MKEKFQVILRRHIQAQQAMQDTFGRLGMMVEQRQIECFIDGLRLAIEIADNLDRELGTI